MDVCEAGFPIASPGDFEAVSIIAKEVGNEVIPHLREGKPMVIAGLSRASEKDIDRCFAAVRHAPRHRIHTFLATSDIHLEHKLRLTRAQGLQKAARAVAHARSLSADVEFSTEDGARSDPAYLVDVIAAVIDAGAVRGGRCARGSPVQVSRAAPPSPPRNAQTTINVPDTVGYSTPEE